MKTRKDSIEKLEIVDFHSNYREAFRSLNQAWIEKYFSMESTDHTYLDFPEKNIINKGGYIFIALLGDNVIGVCALMKMEDPVYEYELSKMAVDPSAQGLGAGKRLGQAVINKAKSLGAKNLYLESNTILKPAISLYRKLGFKELIGRKSPYERSNIQMALVFE